MRRDGFHRLVLGDGRIVEGPVVVVRDNDGRMVSWHLLHGEEPSTAWLGGDFHVKDEIPT